MAGMLDLLRELYPLRLAPVSAGLDEAVEILRRELPFEVHEYESDLECNGWIVPQKWEVEKAEIRRDGELVYDGMHHPLGVIGYSQPFQGTVGLDELKEHLVSHHRLRDALVYHCDMYYKPWKREWGFSMPQSAVDQLPDGEYEVDLRTTFEQGTMKVCDFFLAGESEETVVLNGHDCHAGQANDDIAGVVVGVEVMKRLMQRPERRLSYRLIVAPEHLGTVFYLSNRSPEEIARLRWGIFLEMLGHHNRLAAQQTFTGDTLLDRAAANVLHHYAEGSEVYPFRKLIGNDETVWEAPGIEVPTISLSRWPHYPVYHSDKDTHEQLDEGRLEEAADVVMRILEVLETNTAMSRRFDGLIALSNPRYDLYISNWDPSIRPEIPSRQQEWSYLMDCLPRYFDGRTTILDVAERHDLPYDEVLAYVRRFEEKDLVELGEEAANPREPLGEVAARDGVGEP